MCLLGRLLVAMGRFQHVAGCESSCLRCKTGKLRRRRQLCAKKLTPVALPAFDANVSLVALTRGSDVDVDRQQPLHCSRSTGTNRRPLLFVGLSCAIGCTVFTGRQAKTRAHRNPRPYTPLNPTNLPFNPGNTTPCPSPGINRWSCAYPASGTTCQARPAAFPSASASCAKFQPSCALLSR